MTTQRQAGTITGRAALIPAHPAFVLLERARALLVEAGRADSPEERFRLAHLAALRTGAALLAQRGRPAAARRRLVSVWVLLESVAPEFAPWTTLFAAGAATRAAVEAGAVGVVGSRAADDQLRAADEFLRLVAADAGLLAA